MVKGPKAKSAKVNEQLLKSLDFESKDPGSKNFLRTSVVAEIKGKNRLPWENLPST